MSVSVVAVGINDWDKYSRPLLDDLRNKDVEIVFIDNGSEPPYPGSKEIIRFCETMSYAESVNAGMMLCSGDWLMVTNNDVRVYKKIKERIEALDPNNLYGFYMHGNVGADYLSGWCYFISRKIFETVGEFDTKFKPMYLEDADYSLRCVKAGFGLEVLDRASWGIIHDPERGGVRSNILAKHKDIYEKNMRYLKEKHGL